MLKQTSIFLVFTVLFSAAVFSQQSASYTTDLADYQHGMELYQQHQYSAAKRIFERVNRRTQKQNLKADCAYYAADCAVRLQQPNADQKMESFVETYPASTKRNSAFSNVANFYFQHGRYGEARKWYKKVNKDGLSRSEMRRFNFNNGYAAFRTGHPEQAKRYFNRVKSDKQYGSQAKYYLGYLAYEGDDYKKANELFEEVDDKDKTSKNVSYFQSNISFKSGNFKKAIEQGKEQLPKSSIRERSELNKIIGESYFNLEEYEKSIPYLKEYRGKRGRLNNTDYYQLGYAYYKKGDYKKAISQFNKIIDGKNAVAQNAYYHLAECYINLDQKQQALNAFKNASEMPYDEKIKEDAALNYAKLSYDIGNNYKSIPEVLTQFLNDYPNSPSKTEIRSLLVDSYVTSRNYKKAMAMLEKSNAFKDKRVYQKVAFYRGLELYSDDQYAKAETNFDKSLSERSDQKFTAKATFWKAECDFNLQNFQDALIGYKEFKGMTAAKQTSEYKDIDYNIGYAYFKQKNYKSAASHFKTYVAKTDIDAKQKNDAFLRMGDSYFAASDYWPAMEAYNKSIALKNVDSDYAYFQKAISYGFVDKNDRKIEDLQAFLKSYPKSIYRDDALYELGNTFVAEDKPKAAIEAYNKLVTKLPNSNYVSKALLKQGLVYYNNDQNEKALGKFKNVAADYANSSEAQQAVKTARNIYVDLGRTDDYAKWVKTLDYVKVSESDIENATYESAENQFVDNNTGAAIKGFKKYLKEFPNGAHALSAHFYLAQLLFKDDKHDASEPHYRYVIEKSRNDYTEKALARLSQVYLENEDYQKAIPVLQRLEKGASFQQNVTFAQSNLMKAYYQQKDYAKTVKYAEKVLANDKVEAKAKSDAHIFIARSAIKTGDEEKAKRAYTEVAKMAHGKLAAEAQYYDAYFKRKDQEYKASNSAVQVLAKDYSSYKEYSVKGLLLMAKNFYDLDDAYQATYILQNIIENFQDFPDVVAEAKSELKRIKTEEAKTNASIDTEEGKNAPAEDQEKGEESPVEDGNGKSQTEKE